MKVTALLGRGRLLGIVVAMGAIGGWGQTANIGWYTTNRAAGTFYISNADQLRGLAQIVNGEIFPEESDFSGRTIVLMNNIDLPAYWRDTSFNNGRGWIPIGRGGGERSFRGVFDGRGHVVSGLFISEIDSGGFYGLFGHVGNGVGDDSAGVMNLGVVGVDITNNGRILESGTGGIAGRVYGRVENCYSEGALSSEAAATGGIVGSLIGGLVRNSYFSGNINASTSTGGVAGIIDSGGAVENSYSMGLVAGSRAVGGVIGSLLAGSVRNCYSLSTVHGGFEVGGIVGTANRTSNLNGIIQDCAALNASVITTADHNGNYVGRVSGIAGANQVLNNAAFDRMAMVGRTTGGSNGIPIFDVDIFRDPTLGGRFTPENGWTVAYDMLPGLFGVPVAKPEHLRLRAVSVGGGTAADPYIIYSAGQLNDLRIGVNTGDAAVAAAHFRLANDIRLDAASYGSAAGWTPIGLSNRPFSGHFDGGGYKIVGLYINNNSLSYAGFFGNVQGNGGVKNLGLDSVNITGSDFVGGVAGSIIGSVSNCYVTGTVAGGDNVGGLVGRHGGGGGVSDCYSAGAVSGANDVGGIVGLAEGVAAIPRVERCYSISDVIGAGSSVGGLVGQIGNNGGIVNSAALNRIIIFEDEEFAGRLLGQTAPGNTFSGSVAFDGMCKNDTGNTSWDTAYAKNGVGISAESISSDSTVNGLFADSLWTSAGGRLPGLFGRSADLPRHLVYTPPRDTARPPDSIAVLEHIREVSVNAGSEAAVVVPLFTNAGEFAAGPNPAGGAAVKFYRQGGRVRSGVLTIYDAAGHVVNKVAVNDDPAFVGAGRRVVAVWDLTDRGGRKVVGGTYLVRGVVATAGGRREKVSVVVGVR